MKKILVTTAICLIGAASMMAQGRINFSNTSATPVKISNPAINGGVAVTLGTASTALFGIGPASTQIQLFAGLTSTSLSLQLIGTAANASFVLNTASLLGASQGSFPGGNPLVTVFDGSAPVFFQFVATSLNGLYSGTSSIIQVTPTLSPAAAAVVFAVAPNANQWNGITMTPTVIVPEPTSLVLAGLGAASLLLFRRRS